MKQKSWLVKPSTKAFIQEARKTPDYSLFDLLHGYLYARWPYLYIGIAIGEHPWAKRLAPLGALFARWMVHRKKQSPPEAQINFADTYHGKVAPLETATRLVMVNEPISVPDLEQVIPYKRARALILQHPDHIVALNCPCRVAHKNPCLPLDVCLIVGEPFASFVMEHHPDKARWISAEEAAEILKAEDERGHVHHVFSRMPCCNAFTPSATVARAAAGPCRRSAMACPCWLLRAMWLRLMKVCAWGVAPAPITVSLAHWK